MTLLASGNVSGSGSLSWSAAPVTYVELLTSVTPTNASIDPGPTPSRCYRVGWVRLATNRDPGDGGGPRGMWLAEHFIHNLHEIWIPPDWLGSMVLLDYFIFAGGTVHVNVVQ